MKLEYKDADEVVDCINTMLDRSPSVEIKKTLEQLLENYILNAPVDRVDLANTFSIVTDLIALVQIIKEKKTKQIPVLVTTEISTPSCTHN